MVCPLGLQGPVEAFDLSVLPWAVRLDELLTDAVPGAEPGMTMGHENLRGCEDVRYLNQALRFPLYVNRPTPPTSWPGTASRRRLESPCRRCA